MRITKIPNVRFNLDKKNGIVFAVFRYKIKPADQNATRLKWSTGEIPPPKYWSKDRQRMKNVKGHPEFLDINNRLNQIAETIRKVYVKNGYGNIKPQKFKKEIEIELGQRIEEKKGPSDFMEFVTDYNQRRKDEPGLSRGTWKNWFSWEKHLCNFFKETGYPKDYDQIDYNFLEEYTTYLFDVKNHSINYVSKQVSMIRQWMFDAWKKDLHSNRKYEGFTVSKIDTNRVALYDDELEALYKYKFDELHHEITRDLFLMQTATLMRRSDIKQITPDHIHTMPNGKKLIDVITEKTGTRVAIPVFWYLEELLKKYNYQIPEKEDHVYNRQLKDVCKIAGLNRPVLWVTSNGGKINKKHRPLHDVVASHCARRSGATKLILDGWPKAMVMKLTGHSTEREFNKYVVVSDRMSAAHVAEKYDILIGNTKKLRAV